MIYHYSRWSPYENRLQIVPLFHGYIKDSVLDEETEEGKNDAVLLAVVVGIVAGVFVLAILALLRA